MSSGSSKYPFNSRVFCNCGMEAPICIANTPLNKGKKFYGCAKYDYKEKKKPCDFFQWLEMDEGQSNMENCPNVGDGLMAELKMALKENREIRKENNELKQKHDVIFWKLMFFLSWGIYFVMKFLG